MQRSSDKISKPIAAPKKRPRRIWSCLECRRKKLQCDHGQPTCGRCVKAGTADQCRYSTSRNIIRERDAETAADSFDDDRLGIASNGPDVVSRLNSLERTIKKLHHHSPAQGSSQLSPPEYKTVHTLAERKAVGFGPDEREQAAAKRSYTDYVTETAKVAEHISGGQPNHSILRGASFRTKFNGNTCTENLVDFIPGLSSFTNDAFANFSAFEQAQQYLNKTEGRWKLKTCRIDFEAECGFRSLLPAKDEADRLKDIYLQSFDFIFPVLHLPTFETLYEQIWREPNTEDGRPTLLVLIIIAIAHCLTPSSVGQDDSLPEAGREVATRILDCCEIWLSYRIQRFDLPIDYQICFLFRLARQLNSRRSKRTWANCGNMLRTLQCSGLHREPDHLGKETSHLDKVLRRKLWAAAAEFELQAAFEHGMPALPWRGQADIRTPVNAIDDLVAPCEADTYTRTSFLSVAGESLRLRHQLNDELNDMNETLSSERAQWYTEAIQCFIREIPRTWVGPSAKAAYALLTITLHQYLLAIHEQQLRLSSSPVQKHLSRLVLLESAVQIIDSHKHALESGSYVIELTCGDHARAVLGMCIAYVSADPVTDNVLISAFEGAVFDALARIYALHSDKLIHFGGGRVQLWLICAAEGIMRCQAEPGARSAHMQRAVDQFWKPFSQLIQSANAGSSTGKPEASTAVLPLNNVNGEAAWPLDERQILEDLTGWTFDDFCFDFNNFSQLGSTIGV